MRLTLSYYLTHHVKVTPTLTREALEPFLRSGRIFALDDHAEDVDFHISWGDPLSKVRTATMETGFFNDALHLDVLGLYQASSLNQTFAFNDFPCPFDAIPLLLAQPHKSKFPQVKNKRTWEGVVLPLQNPGDRSICRGNSPADYYQFVEKACEAYGSRLFLKLHPWNNGEIEKRFREMASKYGCTIDRCDVSVIDHCEFVMVFNSTFVVDCLLRKVPVAQYAPGYFWNVPPVHYSHRNFPVEVPRCPGFETAATDVCNFLLWHYCFSSHLPTEDMVEIFEVFARSGNIYPLLIEHSYAHWLSQKST